MQAIPTYKMSTFRLLEKVYDDLDKTGKKFLWGEKNGNNWFLALKNCNSLCQPKANGCLGIKNFKGINKALIADLWWNEERSLWV